MQIAKNTVVTLSYELLDSDGQVQEKSDEPVSYLHGGYDGIFPAVEEALHGKSVGDTCTITLQPEDAFGEYDEQLIIVEPRKLFPPTVEVGMQFEGSPEGHEDDSILYTVTEIADDKVIVDGNHPLAGQTLHFKCEITDVRQASKEETEHGHIHGPHGHEH